MVFSKSHDFGYETRLRLREKNGMPLRLGSRFSYPAILEIPVSILNLV